MSHFKKIATWRERIGQTSEFPLHLATDVERAMEAEIAELRSSVASPSLPSDDFARGVIAALGVMTAHGYPHGSTYHDEIVHSVGEASIYAAAEDEDYEWAGLDPAKKPTAVQQAVKTAEA